MSEPKNTVYAERLWPSPGYFLATLLIIPATMVLLMPFSINSGIFIGIAIYIVVAAIFLISSKSISVENGILHAGRANIATNLTGSVEPLDSVTYRQEIGRKLDARTFLVISGWTKTGVKIEITDEADPTPFWIVSTRRPEALARAITNSRAND